MKLNPPLFQPGTKQQVLVGLIFGLLTLVLAVQICLRILFPWDMWIWSESPFLTDQVKLDLGIPVFTSPNDGNSFVYSQGLEYVSKLLLKPAGAQLDIRWIRSINCAIGLLVSVVMTAICHELALIRTPMRLTKLAITTGWLGSLLLVFKNFTADVAHPDNLAALHATSSLLLVLISIRTRNLRIAFASIIWASAGVYCKQTQAFTVIGVALAFALQRQWSITHRAILGVTGISALMLAVYFFWMPDFSRFYTFELLSHHGVNLNKLFSIADGFKRWDRIIMLSLGLAMICAAIPGLRLLRRSAPDNPALLTWAIVGCFAVSPNLASFLKAMGTWNNLMLPLIWLFLPLWPALWNWLGRENSLKQTAAVALICIVLTPVKLPATKAQWNYCNAVENAIREDHENGRRVLVSHGTAFLIRAGIRDVPLDRANSMLELYAGGCRDFPETEKRIRTGFYDRIYLISEQWYPPELRALIATHYRPVKTIPKPEWQGRLVFGHQGLMDDCEILEYKREPSK